MELSASSFQPARVGNYCTQVQYFNQGLILDFEDFDDPDHWGEFMGPPANQFRGQFLERPCRHCGKTFAVDTMKFRAVSRVHCSAKCREAGRLQNARRNREKYRELKRQRLQEAGQ